MREKELPGQVRFQGPARNYADRYRQYEVEKEKLKQTCASCKEYEQAVRRLAKKYRI